MAKKAGKNENFIILLSILAVAIIVVVGAYVAFFSESQEKPAAPETVKEIDDRISPDLNQGLIVEVNRIRHRGLLEQILKMGTSWKNKPIFYYIANLDGLEYISKDVAAAGGAEGELLFTDWDTMFQENRVMKDITEEQETSEITLTIVERIKSGLLGFQSNDVEQEVIHVTYDYRTGRWSGDDCLKDSDGYGHYVGDAFEVWFNVYQTDYDDDGIPYWTEVNVLNTDPRSDDSLLDPDGDGIPTSWEWKWGYDPHTLDDHRNLDPDIDGIDNIEEYQMSKWFADPFSQDIYIETDGMERGGPFDPPHVFYDESQQIMIERFCEHGLNVYIDNGWPGGPINGGGELLTHIDTISQESGVMLQFYNNHFSDARKGIFRYVIVGHNAGFCIASKSNRYDTMVIDSSPYRLLKRMAFTPRTQRIVLAAAAMHELGHSFGIAPWTFEGNDNLTFAGGRQAKQQYGDTWGDYYSVMNYYHIWDKKLVDYSDGSNGPPYDQNDWEHFYLPTFNIESNAMEDPELELPGKDRIIDEEPEPTDDKWTYDENLTQEYLTELSNKCFVENVDFDLRVYVESANASSADNAQRNVRLYAKPDTGATYSIWTLISEGYEDSDDALHFYSINDIIDDIQSSD